MAHIGFRDHAAERFHERQGRPMTAADRHAIITAIRDKTAIVRRRHQESGVSVLSIRLPPGDIATVVYDPMSRFVVTVLPVGGKIMDPEKMKRRLAKWRTSINPHRRARYEAADDHEYA